MVFTVVVVPYAIAYYRTKCSAEIIYIPFGCINFPRVKYIIIIPYATITLIFGFAYIILEPTNVCRACVTVNRIIVAILRINYITFANRRNGCKPCVVIAALLLPVGRIMVDNYVAVFKL